ncbi:nuclear transport factor 2 family protein [Acanthopleuribacter pedis]|nr:nuclear transport factor 2 family protein [Acanthopleuribacter pedis]
MLLCLSGISVLHAGETAGQAEVRTLIEKAYLHGAWNEQNVADMEAGFHKDFAIFSPKGKEMARYEIADWVAGIKKRKASKDYDPNRSKVEYKITQLDVTGGAASARVELIQNGKLIFTDYLSFIKFEDGWKIAAKVYHRHK